MGQGEDYIHKERLLSWNIEPGKEQGRFPGRQVPSRGSGELETLGKSTQALGGHSLKLPDHN